MFPLIFAILMMMSAWATWRRNPMYSTRSTLRSAAVALLAIAGAIGLIIAAVNLTSGKSPAVVFTTLAVVIIFGTLALIFIIQAVTVPKESRPAALPHSAKLVTTNRRKIYKWLKVFAALVLVFALGGLVPGAVRYISLILGGFTLFLAIILLPVMYYASRGFDQSLTEIELNPWVHWHYTPDQWQQWSGAQADRLKATPAAFVLRRDWHKVALTLAAIGAGTYIYLPATRVEKTFYIAGVCAAILVTVVLLGRGGSRAADKMRAKLLHATPEAYFGRDGVFCDGVFTPWLNVSTYLIAASIDERQPRSLLLRFERSVPNPYGASQVLPIHQSVLIPANADSDLARLQHELTARCPKAQIALA